MSVPPHCAARPRGPLVYKGDAIRRRLTYAALCSLASASLLSDQAQAANAGSAVGEPLAVNDATLAASAVPASMPASAPVATPEPLMPAARQKATTLFNFLGFIEFPPSSLPRPDSPLVIGVTGADNVYDELGEILKGRIVNGHPVVRRRLLDTDALSGVHLLFVGGKVNLTQSSLVKAARSSSVLLVTEVPNGLESGAIFNFVMDGERVRFEAALEAADRAAIRISSRILTLAERVTRNR